MKNFIKTTLLLLSIIVSYPLYADSVPTTLMYHRVLSAGQPCPELLIDAKVSSEYTAEGLLLTGNEGFVRLDKYYSLGERMIRYHVKLSGDATAIFQSDTGDFKVRVNMTDQTLSVATNPAVWKKVDFLNVDHEYLIEIYHEYQKNVVQIIDVYTGDAEQIVLVNDGAGGHGVGVVNSGFYVGAQHDYYCFGLEGGSSLLVKQISVIAGACDLTLLMYGDSITEGEGYYPTKDFPTVWTQLIMNAVKGKALGSGRGGCQIAQVLERIKNELPYVKAKYVMVTIGTNGGNTEDNLSQLVEYIVAQGSIPILNNIPANESGSHIAANEMIAKVREKYNIKGCKFDLATSLLHDGKEVDKSTMYHEDYSFGQIYHHPNVKGSRLMYVRSLIDVPEIYE